MTPDDREGLLLSIGVHVVVLLLLALVAATPRETLRRDYPRPIVEVDMVRFAPTRPVLVGEPEAAVEGAASDAPEQPEVERPTPPAATPVRVPERPAARPPRPDPLPRPSTQETARPTRPNPPSAATRPEPRPTSPRQPRPTESAGAGTGQGTSPGTGQSGTGSGAGGDAAVEVGFQFGNRSFTCPTPPNDGTLTGTVVYSVQFAPNGRYVSGRPRSRNAPLEAAVGRVLSGCRADPLPPQADQVPQTTTATFRFSVN